MTVSRQPTEPPAYRPAAVSAAVSAPGSAGRPGCRQTGPMHEYRFDRDTAVAPIDRRRAAVELHPEWNVDGRILNGGYLQAVVLRAAVAACPTAGQPVAVSSLFAAAPTPGPAVVDAEVLRAGRRVTAVSATLRQEDAVIASSLVTVAADGALPAADRAAASLPMPPVPPPEACVRVAPAHLPGPPGLADLVDYAFVPDNSRWLSGDTSGGPHIRCWMSFADPVRLVRNPSSRRSPPRRSACAAMVFVRTATPAARACVPRDAQIDPAGLLRAGQVWLGPDAATSGGCLRPAHPGPLPAGSARRAIRRRDRRRGRTALGFRWNAHRTVPADRARPPRVTG